MGNVVTVFADDPAPHIVNRPTSATSPPGNGRIIIPFVFQSVFLMMSH